VLIGEGEGPTACVTVRDQGMGMAPEELDRVFERFARTERARRSGAAGLGLGLYACRGIVSAHGGTIVVASDGYDRGTTVTVTLPTMDLEVEPTGA
jgi:signal transduction histidine kinase